MKKRLFMGFVILALGLIIQADSCCAVTLRETRPDLTQAEIETMHKYKCYKDLYRAAKQALPDIPDVLIKLFIDYGVTLSLCFEQPWVIYQHSSIEPLLRTLNRNRYKPVMIKSIGLTSPYETSGALIVKSVADSTGLPSHLFAVSEWYYRPEGSVDNEKRFSSDTPIEPDKTYNIKNLFHYGFGIHIPEEIEPESQKYLLETLEAQAAAFKAQTIIHQEKTKRALKRGCIIS